ncbi:MAG: lipoprotein-releasing system ATP-binding protein LolD [Lysobacteraceae bacterium]|nr:MAG: lipoprotein-releasing system ATP-binding protein LolD [Xanthomonadaceae bacterium]
MQQQAREVVLECRGLSKVYQQGRNELQILSDVSFSIHAGETVAIVGASGAGKSTLLHCMGGLDQASEGDVLVAGQSMAKLGNAARGRLRNQALGFVYQFHHLLPEFTALENVAMPLLIRGEAVASARQRASDLLDRVGLAERLTHRPGELSGGERQRAAVARALINNPRCVLGDEPTGNLDEKTAARVHGLMLELNQEFGTALVLVTHDRHLASKMDRTLELSEGVLREL